MTPDPDTYVLSALKTIKTQPITNGCLIHNIQVIVIVKTVFKIDKYTVYGI